MQADPQLSATVAPLVDAAEHEQRIATVFHRYNDRRRRALVDAVADGISTREVRAELDPDLTALALVGPVVYRRLMIGSPFAAADVERLVDQVLGDPPDA